MRLSAPLVAATFLAAVAHAEEPAPSQPLAQARLDGRVWERGTLTAIEGAQVRVSGNEGGTTDAEGRFSIDVAPGDVEVVITADDYLPLRVTEHLKAGEGVKVEYRLLPRGKRRYESTVRGEARHEGERFSLKDQELHKIPGSLGDPFRVVGMLPGVSTPLTILPLYVIRGASPGTNGFFLDGMRVPQLFHFLVGGGVVHGSLVDHLDFYPGAYDVSFGRYAGGVIDAETRPAQPKGQHAQAELRLYDVSALAEVNLPRGVRIEASGHYGYPSFIFHAIDNRVDLQYGDYQLRLDWRGLTVEALGSYDSASIANSALQSGLLADLPDNFRLTFHRLQVRERDRVGRVELEAALTGGIDEMSSFNGYGVRKLGLGWRFLLRSKWRRFRLFAGTDGEVSRFSAENFADASGPGAPDEFGELSGNRDGVVAGAFVQGTLDIIPTRLVATLGVRADVYHAGTNTLLGIDPRLQLRATLLPWLELQGGIGVYQQPPSFPVALPGIDTFALQLGLQRAYQGSVGVQAKLPEGFSFSLTGYYQQYHNVNDVVLDFGPLICTSPPPESLSGLPATILRQIDGQSFGMELLLRRQIGRVSGWIAYTLSRSERIYSCGLRPADFDQSHLLNVVLQVQLPWNLVLGTRLYVATGRPVTMLEPPDGRSTVRNNTRLPDYVQLDLRLDRDWAFAKWTLSAFVEVVNLTFSESDFGFTYPEINGLKRYDLPQLNGFRWILPSIGVRGGF